VNTRRISPPRLLPLELAQGGFVTLSGIALLLLCVAIPVAAEQPIAPPPPSAPRPTIWVAPFTPIEEAFVDSQVSIGITETLTTTLGRTTGLRVVVTDVAFGALLRDTRDRTAAIEVARTLGATWLVSGTYQHLGPRLGITTRLTEVDTNELVAEISVDGRFDELFALQDLLVDKVGYRLRVETPKPTRRREHIDHTLAAPNTAATTGPDRGSFPLRSSTTIAQNQTDRATLRARRVTDPINIDGVLSEQVYEDMIPTSGFIQVEPREGELATEQTEIWILFDDDNLYVSARCFDSAPESVWVANEMRRDGLGQGELVGVLLDTFYDRRNAVEFVVNPLGGRMDGQITNERAWNGDWNPIWDVRAGRFDGGWTFEAEIPFKSLRYRPGRVQTWGVQVERIVAWKNEYSTLAPVPASRGYLAAMMISQAATLVGVEVPDAGLNLEIKPYVIGEVATDRFAGRQADAATGDVGLDVKYGVTENMVADLTANTDFAQVEADEQQINLTRFSLFFPEKREFFLENQGLFAFGGEASGGQFAGTSNTPILFYSRQIGLNQGLEVPIEAGGRLTGRIGKSSLGILNVQTADTPSANATATNFTVLSARHDLLRRSSVGVLFTGRSVSRTGVGSNGAFGVDGLFSFYENLNISTYWARTHTTTLDDDDLSYRAQLDYTGDRYGLQLERLIVGDDFNPEVGFLRRDNFARSFGLARFSPRPQTIAAIRKLTWEGQFDYITNRDGVLETRQTQGRFTVDLENSDQFQLAHIRNYEFLERPFPIATDVTIAVGGYTFADTEAAYLFGRQRPLSGRVSLQHGNFYDGQKTSLIFGFGGGFAGGTRVKLTRQLSLEPAISLHRITLPQGRFTTRLLTARTIYTATPFMFVSALVQYNSDTNAVSSNLRLRWEYRPGSELFLVYNEQRDTLVPHRFPEIQNRALIVKVNRLFRF